jgi:hypothetical protein
MGDLTPMMTPMTMNAIEFQAVAHDGVLDIPPEHRSRLNGKTVRVVLVDAEVTGARDAETLFMRLRRVRVQGPADLSANHDAYILDERNA